MYYFTCVAVPENITGVDKAIFNRLNLFKKNNVPSKIISIEYNHMSHNTHVNHGVEYDTINMYDYYQKCTHLKSSQPIDLLRYWEEDLGYTLEVVSHQLDICVKSKEGKLLKYVRFVNTERKQINFINHISSIGTINRHERYDNRGFLSSVRYLGPDEKVFLEQFYTPKGEIVIEKHYDINQQDAPVIIFLFKDDGTQVTFNNEDEFIAHFIEDLYKPGDVFILDRPYEYVKPFAMVNPIIPASIFLHTTHLPDEYSEGRAFKWPYNFLGDHINRFNSLICSTEFQKQDVLDYSNFHGEVFNIPVGYIKDKDVTEVNDFSHKHPFKIISVSRYIHSKQLDHQIRLVHRLKKEFPEISLDIYGFGGIGGAQDVLEDLINDLDANEYIKLKGYSRDLSNLYEESGLSLFTSKEEGFALVLLESYNHHTPVIGYDVKYGPSEIIQDNVNGNLITLDDEEALYQATRKFLLDPQLRETYYKNCLLTKQKYSESSNFKLWEKFIDFQS